MTLKPIFYIIHENGHTWCWWWNSALAINHGAKNFLILRDLKVHCHVDKVLPLDLILSQFKQAPSFTPSLIWSSYYYMPYFTEWCLDNQNNLKNLYEYTSSTFLKKLMTVRNWQLLPSYSERQCRVVIVEIHLTPHRPSDFTGMNYWLCLPWKSTHLTGLLENMSLSIICGFNMIVLLKCVSAVKELSWTLDCSWMRSSSFLTCTLTWLESSCFSPLGGGVVGNWSLCRYNQC